MVFQNQKTFVKQFHERNAPPGVVGRNQSTLGTLPVHLNCKNMITLVFLPEIGKN